MALQIPNTANSVASTKGNNIPDAQGRFGQISYQPTNQPNVPVAMGGVTPDLGAEAQAITHFANAVGSVIDDYEQKDKALRKSNSTMALAENRMKFQQDVFNSRDELMKTGTENNWTPKDFQEAFKTRTDELHAKYFAESGYEDPEVGMAAKITGQEELMRANQGYLKDVIIPMRTSAAKESLFNLMTYQTQTVGGVAQKGDPTEAVQTLLEARKKVVDTLNSPEARVFLGPEELLKERQRLDKELSQAFLQGLMSRDIVVPPGSKDPDGQKASLTVRHLESVKALIQQRPDLFFGLQGDDLAKVDQRIDQAITGVQDREIRRMDLMERRRERAEKQAQQSKTYSLWFGMRDGKVGPDEVFKALATGKISDSGGKMLLEYYDGQSKKQTKLNNALIVVQSNLDKGLSYARPSQDSKRELDHHYEAFISTPTYQSASQDQKASMLADVYGRAGWLPDQFVDFLQKHIRSDNPQNVQAAFITMKKLEGSNPTLLEAFSPQDKAMYVNLKYGMPPQDAAQMRQKQLRQNPSELKIQTEQTNKAIGGKTETDRAANIKNDLNSRIKSKFNSWFDFGTPDVPKQVYSDYETMVREYLPLVGYDKAKAGELAFGQISSQMGISELDGKRRVMRFSPETVFRANETTKKYMQSQWKADLAQLKKESPDLANASDDSFFLVSSEITSGKTPYWTVMYRDPVYGLPRPVTGPDGTVKLFTYDNSTQLQEERDALEKRIEKSKAERQRLVEAELNKPKPMGLSGGAMKGDKSIGTAAALAASLKENK